MPGGHAELAKAMQPAQLRRAAAGPDPPRRGRHGRPRRGRPPPTRRGRTDPARHFAGQRLDPPAAVGRPSPRGEHERAAADAAASPATWSKPATSAPARRARPRPDRGSAATACDLDLLDQIGARASPAPAPLGELLAGKAAPATRGRHSTHMPAPRQPAAPDPAPARRRARPRSGSCSRRGRGVRVATQRRVRVRALPACSTSTSRVLVWSMPLPLIGRSFGLSGSSSAPAPRSSRAGRARP